MIYDQIYSVYEKIKLMAPTRSDAQLRLACIIGALGGLTDYNDEKIRLLAQELINFGLPAIPEELKID